MRIFTINTRLKHHVTIFQELQSLWAIIYFRVLHQGQLDQKFVTVGCRILVPEYGAMHLELVPMLIGFFTYKIATFAQAIEEALGGITRKTQL